MNTPYLKQTFKSFSQGEKIQYNSYDRTPRKHYVALPKNVIVSKLVPSVYEDKNADKELAIKFFILSFKISYQGMFVLRGSEVLTKTER